MRIAREGYPFILVAGLSAFFAALLGWNWVSLLLVLIALGFVGFFRDPERIPPEEKDLILAPADGKVVRIQGLVKDEFFGETGTRVSIFLSPLDVHINRAPVGGKIEKMEYQRGRFFAAYKDEASQKNERNGLRLLDAKGRKLGVVQIAGVLARRIVCRVRAGDSLKAGERFGLIMFGSRTDLLLPAGVRVEVAEGQRVRGGETIIGRFL